MNYGRSRETRQEFRPTAETEQNGLSISDLPKLFWAGVALLTVNLGIVAAISISPELNVSMYGEVQPVVSSVYKPSPFTEVVETNTSAKVRPPEKVRPIIEETAPADPTHAQLEIPRSTQSLAIPRATATPATAQQMDIRRATPASRAVYSNDPLPVRRATQTAFVVN